MNVQPILGIVGASGLIGSEVTRCFCSKGWKVRSYGRKNVDVLLDLEDRESISQAAFDGLTAFAHCAGATDEAYNENAEKAYWRSTAGIELLGRRLIEQGVFCITYVSTAHVYGDLRGAVSEHTPVAPLSPYAIGHYAAERTLVRLGRSSGARMLIMRPNAVYGVPPQNFSRWQLIPFAFPREACQTKRITLKTSGFQKRNFVGTPAISQAIYQFIQSRDVEAEVAIQNPVGCSTLSVRSFAQKVAAVIGQQLGESVVVDAPDGVDNTPDFAFISDYMPDLNEPLSLDTFIHKLAETLVHPPMSMEKVS